MNELLSWESERKDLLQAARHSDVNITCNFYMYLHGDEFDETADTLVKK